MASLMRISQLAEKSGKTNRALRFYEELGILIPQERTASGYRMYGEDALLRIEWIEKLHMIGFSLPEIQEFLLSFKNIAFGPDMMMRLRELYQSKLIETTKTIERLQQLNAELQTSIDYLEVCQKCEPSTASSSCKRCEKQAPAVSPLLISVITNSV